MAFPFALLERLRLTKAAMPETSKAALGANGPFRKPEQDHARMAAIARVASKGVYAGGGPIADEAGRCKVEGRWGFGRVSAESGNLTDRLSAAE
jgi:hypothetical protein